MFSFSSPDGYRDSLPGIRQKTLAYGKETLMAEFRLQRGSVLPRHAHLHEQTGYLVAGHMTLSIGDQEAEMRPGDSWNIPAHLEHGATVHEDAVAIEVFHPVRTDLLP